MEISVVTVVVLAECLAVFSCGTKSRRTFDISLNGFSVVFKEK